MKRTVRLLASFLVLLAVTVSCSGDDGESGTPTSEGGGENTAAPDTPGDPQTGGTLRFAEITVPQTMDPVATGGSFSQINALFALYGALATISTDSGEVEMGMAESIESVDGGTTWTVNLRDGLEFTDGTPLDAEAVRFNWARVADVQFRSPGILTMLAVESYTVTAPLTLTVVLKKPNTQFDRSVAYTSLRFVASPTAVTAKGPDYGTDTPIGAGPFVLTQWLRGTRMTFAKNPGYWDAPRPYVDELVIAAVPDEEQRFNALDAGQFDVQFMGAGRGDAARRARSDGFGVVDLPQLSGQSFGYRVTSAPFDDVRVRRAISMALDNEAIVDVAYDGDPPDALFPPSSEFRSSDPTALFPERDLVEAQRLIDAYLDDNGLSELTFTMSGVGGNSSTRDAFELAQAQVHELDRVRVEISLVELTEYFTVIRSDEVQMFQSGLLGPQWPDPQLFDGLHSQSLANTSRYANPDVDAMLEAARSTADREEQVEIYKDLQPIIVEDMPFYTIMWAEYFFVHHERVHDVVSFSDAALRSDLAWIEQ